MYTAPSPNFGTPPGVSITFAHDQNCSDDDIGDDNLRLSANHRVEGKGDTCENINVDLPPNSPHSFCHGGISDAPPILPSQQSCNKIPQLTELLNCPRTSGTGEKGKASATPEVLASQASESTKSRKHWKLEERLASVPPLPPTPPSSSHKLALVLPHPPSSSAPDPLAHPPSSLSRPPSSSSWASSSLSCPHLSLSHTSSASSCMQSASCTPSSSSGTPSASSHALSPAPCTSRPSNTNINPSLIDLDGGSYDAESPNEPGDDSDAVALCTGSPSMSTPPRTPHWTGQSLQIKSATPTYTQPLLNKANHFYKMFLLITHPFLEITSQRRHFTKDAWEGAHEPLESEENVTVKFTADTKTALHSLGTTFCRSLGSQLLSHVPSNYGFGDTEKPARDNIVKQLLTSGNLALTSDKTTILHTSPFQHPLLETVIIALAFKGCPPLAATNPCHFDSIPLSMIVFACTLINHALDHHLSNDPSARCDLSGPNYCPVFQSYLEGLELLKHENPGSSAAVQRELWEKGRKVAKIPSQGPQVIVHFTTGLSAEEIEAELAAQGAC
ncbi:hypothetical protein K439DRAFT_1623685 [Ramaria rubella]|nr:hypothetical protein K439DRAFT_1623685 [Ramaria rubella]